MENQSFIKYLLNKINSKLTIVSKVLLIVYVCSLFIPIPPSDTVNTDILTKLLAFYLFIIVTISLFLLLFLIGAYIYFTSEQSSKEKQVKFILTVLITPIISYVIYVMFNITTPFQLLSFLPLLALIIIQAINFALFGADNFIIFIDKSFPRFTFDFTKIKKIFFKK